MTDRANIFEMFSNRLFLAPMAGYTDVAFREFCKLRGAGLTVTEMVSVRGLVHGSENTKTLMRISTLESPSCVQFFGNDPNDFARAAADADCDIIDINMGCPMPKIVKNGDGSALIKNPVLAGEIVKAIKRVTDRPVTVKTRLGYETGKSGAEELIKRVADAGAAFVTVHGRYAEQRYEGHSDPEAVAELAVRSEIPIVYSGDADESNIDKLKIMPFAAIAIGRAALRNPDIFGGKTAAPTETAIAFLDVLEKYFDDRYSVNQARKFFVHFFKGVIGGKSIRDSVNRAGSVKEIREILDKSTTA